MNIPLVSNSLDPDQARFGPNCFHDYKPMSDDTSDQVKKITENMNIVEIKVHSIVKIQYMLNLILIVYLTFPSQGKYFKISQIICYCKDFLCVV